MVSLDLRCFGSGLLTKQAEVAESSAFIREHVRWVGTTPASVEPCIYTMTRDEDFIIALIPTRPNIAVVRQHHHDNHR